MEKSLASIPQEKGTVLGLSEIAANYKASRGFYTLSGGLRCSQLTGNLEGSLRSGATKSKDGFIGSVEGKKTIEELKVFVKHFLSIPYASMLTTSTITNGRFGYLPCMQSMYRAWVHMLHGAGFFIPLPQTSPLPFSPMLVAGPEGADICSYSLLGPSAGARSSAMASS